LPRHLLAECMTVGIDAGSHRGDEFLELPFLTRSRSGPIGPSRPGTPPVNLSPRHARQS
jgi:hypothetical protein